jgi:hypothetical protein
MPAWGQSWDARYFIAEGLNLSYNEPYHVKVQVSRAFTLCSVTCCTTASPASQRL